MKGTFRRIGALVKLSLLELWRRNDMFALLVLALVLLVPLSLAKPFGASGATRYFDEAALLLVCIIGRLALRNTYVDRIPVNRAQGAEDAWAAFPLNSMRIGAQASSAWVSSCRSEPG